VCVSRGLQLCSLLLKCSCSVATDKFTACVPEKVEVKADKVVGFLKGRVGFGVRVIRPQGAVLGYGVNCFLDVVGTARKFGEVVLLVVCP
jgi:hypothetical protein